MPQCSRAWHTGKGRHALTQVETQHLQQGGGVTKHRLWDFQWPAVCSMVTVAQCNRAGQAERAATQAETQHLLRGGGAEEEVQNTDSRTVSSKLAATREVGRRYGHGMSGWV